MTTPTREEIIQEATKLYMQRNHQISCNTPELHELKEEGTYQEAQRDLMRSEGHEVMNYLEELAAEAGFDLVKTKQKFSKETSKLRIDLEEALRSGVFISGGKGTTKSNLGMTICDMLIRKGVVVKVFDISRVWLKSSVPRVYEITNDAQLRIDLYESAIFDLSRLTPLAAKQVISKLLEIEWRLQIDTSEKERKPIVYVFEEVQMLVPQGQLRSEEAQYVLRLMTTGRNFDLGYLAITQRPALCDTSVFELSFQRYFSRMDGENDLKKVTNYIGAKKTKKLASLKLGEFYYDMGKETKLIKTELFKSNVKPTKFQSIRSHKEAETKKKTQPTETDMLRTASILLQLGALLVFVLAIFFALSNYS